MVLIMYNNMPQHSDNTSKKCTQSSYTFWISSANERYPKRVPKVSKVPKIPKNFTEKEILMVSGMY